MIGHERRLPSIRPARVVIDNFALAVSHGLLLLAAWRLMRRPDLDREGPAPGWRAGRRRDA